jgi:starch synthase
MQILFAVSEAVPLIKTGGLADVAGALPRAFKDYGTDARVVLPNYRDIPQQFKGKFETLHTFTVQVGWRHQYCGLMKAEIEGIYYYLIDNEYYFKRGSLYGYDDEAERFSFFCLALVAALPYLDFKPDILHCHDWQTGLIPLLLKLKADANTDDIKTVFTIHNLKYQGVFAPELLEDYLSVNRGVLSAYDLEFYQGFSCMKAALRHADKLTTVSPTYAMEIQTPEYGEKLDGLLRERSDDLHGIINGIDTKAFDPMNDPHVPFKYRNALNKKKKNKKALQAELSLPEQTDIPLIGMVTRLVEQKGLDLLGYILEQLMQEPLQLVILGSGDYRYEVMLQNMRDRYPEKLYVYFGFSDELARRIYAASDLYLMPSQFEPCGLSQMIALRYRSIPIVRETGGLKDTVQSYNQYTGEGNGFSFSNYQADDLLFTFRRALSFYQDDSCWKSIIQNITKSDHSWTKSASKYIALYKQLLGEFS